MLLCTCVLVFLCPFDFAQGRLFTAAFYSCLISVNPCKSVSNIFGPCQSVSKNKSAALVVYRLFKVHIRHLADGWVHAEVVLQLKAEYAGDDAAREGFALVAIVTHIAVEETACRLDAVLRIN